MLVSVLIPSRNDPYINSTVDNLRKTAKEDIEIIVKEDTKGEGRRVLINQAAREAKGKFLFILDAHCQMLTEGWDVEMSLLCQERDIVVSVIDAIDPKTFARLNHNYGLVSLNPFLHEKWGRIKDNGETVQETMAFTGCSWMIRKDRFWELGGYDESWYIYGGDGPEWALKTWLSGGRCLIVKDVICGHVFETNLGNKLYPLDPYKIEAVYTEIRKMFYSGQGPYQIFPIAWLVGKFWPLPEWEGKLAPASPYLIKSEEQVIDDNEIVKVREEIRVLYHEPEGKMNITQGKTMVFCGANPDVLVEEVQVFEFDR